MAMLITISVLASSLEASAAALGPECNSCNQRTVFYDQQFRYREKTGEHIIDINGRQAICFIYTEYYENIYYCNNCYTYRYTTEIIPNVHSLNQ